MEVLEILTDCERSITVEDNNGGIIEQETNITFDKEKPENIKQEHVQDEKCLNFKEENVLNSYEGATNSTNLYKSGNFETDLYSFKMNSHCSQEVTVFFLNKENHEQRHDCLTVVEINKKFLMALFEHTTLIILRKKPVKRKVLDFFQEKNVASKRCLVRCSSITHGLALAKIWRDITEGPESKKANNVFSNYQRPDRVASKNLVHEYQSQNGLSECSGFQDIEEKADVSFEIYRKDGFLSYASKKMTVNHTIFYKSGGDIYFVKEKYLNAFGKIVVPKKKSAKMVKRL